MVANLTERLHPQTPSHTLKILDAEFYQTALYDWSFNKLFEVKHSCKIVAPKAKEQKQKQVFSVDFLMHKAILLTSEKEHR